MAVRVMNESTEIRELAQVLALAPTANSLDNIFIAPDVAADGVTFKHTGREVVTVRNFDATNPYTFTLKSVIDSLNRLGDIGPYTLAAGEEASIIVSRTGFQSSTTAVVIVMENVAVKVAVNRVPSQVS